jgi:hypothetical protein
LGTSSSCLCMKLITITDPQIRYKKKGKCLVYLKGAGESHSETWKQNKNDENTVIYMETEWKHFWPTLTKKTLAI